MRIGLGMGGATVDEAVANVRQAAVDGFPMASFSNIFGLDAITTCALAGRELAKEGLSIELGTFVVPTYPRHPVAMAQHALTAHGACEGRFLLGIGLSHQIVIETMWGMSFDKPARHMREYLSVLMPLLREGSVSFEGDLYRVNANLERPSGSGPPVVIAALAPVMLKLAGSMTDGTATWMTGPKTIASHVAPRITAAADAAGRPEPRIIVSLPVCVTNDVAGARERAASVFQVYGGLPSYRAMLDREGAEGPADVAILGTEEQVTEGIQSLFDAGATDFGASVFGSPEEIEQTRALLETLL